MRRFGIAALIAALALSGCVTVPYGPSATALPGTGMSWERFRYDDAGCRQFASAQVGGKTANEVAMDSGAASALVGALVGAAAGAAIDGGHGAAVGAGSGFAIGALAGTGAASASGYELQRRYDSAYVQCMYAQGHQVPVYGNLTSRPPSPAYAPTYPPPPPPPR